jgi:hypothetical protein
VLRRRAIRVAGRRIETIRNAASVRPGQSGLLLCPCILSCLLPTLQPFPAFTPATNGVPQAKSSATEPRPSFDRVACGFGCRAGREPDGACLAGRGSRPRRAIRAAGATIPDSADSVVVRGSTTGPLQTRVGTSMPAHRSPGHSQSTAIPVRACKRAHLGGPFDVMVAHRGFEPLISALRGRCPRPLDECAAT